MSSSDDASAMHRPMKKQPLLSELSRRRKLRLFTGVVSSGARVLEVGGGSGWFTLRLRELGYAAETLDLVEPADHVGSINEWRRLGLVSESFDAVVGWEVIEHVDCLDAMLSLCRPGGFIALSSPHPQWDWSMKCLEALGLTQRRTSPHDNLTDFSKIPLTRALFQRPAWIHQVAIFQKPDAAVSADQF